jgi:hypothetical protein
MDDFNFERKFFRLSIKAHKRLCLRKVANLSEIYFEENILLNTVKASYKISQGTEQLVFPKDVFAAFGIFPLELFCDII